jgi:GAF domain-containing protein
VAARWVLETQAGAAPGAVAGELEVGADFHFAVHNAAGMVSVQEGISVAEALIRLRAFAFSSDRLLAGVAEDVVDLLTGVADRCVNLLGVSAAGVMLASPPGSLGLVASSSEAMRLLELFELQEQEGPCLDAFRTGERVGHENLDAGSGRWPSFSAAALQAGFQSASALPLRLRDVTLGALNLLSITRAPMDEADVIVARAFADLATLSIVQHRASAEAQRLNEQLSGALTSRVVIEQAKGVISERADVDLAQAFSRLRAYARSNNLRLTDVARAAIDGTLDPLAWAAV